jgi:hypothetical protein
MGNYDQDVKRRREFDVGPGRKPGSPTSTQEGQMVQRREDAAKARPNPLPAPVWSPPIINSPSPVPYPTANSPAPGESYSHGQSYGRGKGERDRRQRTKNGRLEDWFGVVLAIALSVTLCYFGAKRFAIHEDWVLVSGVVMSVVFTVLLNGPLKIIRRIALVAIAIGLLIAIISAIAG